LPYTESVSAKGMATFLYVGQVVSALLCLALSLWRLVTHDFLDPGTPGNLKDNIAYSLYAFYAMALVEAFIFLVEKMYWEYKISCKKLFERVDEKAQLGGDCVDTIRSFFYQVLPRTSIDCCVEEGGENILLKIFFIENLKNCCAASYCVVVVMCVRCIQGAWRRVFSQDWR
jgi:hypothetical protein